jgi:hypothetical protein
VESKDATFLYNQGRCFEQNARHADAISRFREYLRVAKGLSEADRAEVDRHIAECRQLQAEQESPPPAAPKQAAPAPLTPPVPSTVANPPPALDLAAGPSTALPDASGPPPVYRTWWFWAGAAAVVAGTAAALFFARSGAGPCDGASFSCRGVK